MSVTNKMKKGDMVMIVDHKNNKLIGKVSYITNVIKDKMDEYLYKVKGFRNYAEERDIRLWIPKQDDKENITSVMPING